MIFLLLEVPKALLAHKVPLVQMALTESTALKALLVPPVLKVLPVLMDKTDKMVKTE